VNAVLASDLHNAVLKLFPIRALLPEAR
jgi:hypothetical protein